eukprot:123014-Pyramimonas_sp.AAC.1
MFGIVRRRIHTNTLARSGRDAWDAWGLGCRVQRVCAGVERFRVRAQGWAQGPGFRVGRCCGLRAMSVFVAGVWAGLSVVLHAGLSLSLIHI